MNPTTQMRGPLRLTTSSAPFPPWLEIVDSMDGEEANIIALNSLLDAGTRPGLQRIQHVDSTSPGPASVKANAPANRNPARAIFEIRRRAGLEWDELSDLFGVSRRIIHHWANGKKPPPDQEDKIHRTLNVLRHLDEGGQRATRERLMETINGLSLFELLVQRCYVDVLRQTPGKGLKDTDIQREPLSEDEQARRRPPLPSTLLGALWDRPKFSVGKVRMSSPR